MDARVEDIAAALGEVYQSAASEKGWDKPLHHLARLFDGEFATFEIYDRQSLQPLFITDNSQIEVHQSYLEHFISRNPRFGLRSKLPQASIDVDYALLDEAEMSGDAFYEDFLGRFGLRYFVGMRVLETQDVFGVFTVQRALKAGHVEDEELRLATALLPQLASAALLHLDRLGQAQRHAALESSLDVLGEVVLTLSRSGDVVARTNAAKQLLEAGDGIDMRAGRLVFTDPVAQERYHKVLRELQTNGPLPRAGQRFVARRPSGGRELVVHVVPLTDGVVASAMATVLITDPARVTVLDTSLVQDAFGLTHAETALACALVEGMSVTRYASDSELSRNTIRTHLQKLMHKCAVSRQQDLVLLLQAYRQ